MVYSQDSYRNIQEDKRNIKDQLGQLPDKTTMGKWNYYEEISLEEQASITNKRSLSGDNGIYGHQSYGIFGTSKYGRPSGMIWGSTPFGTWDDAKWGEIRQGFKLGNAQGTLGTSKLGARAIEWILHSVTNPENIFRERFRDTTFKDTDNTTADWDVASYKIDFTTGEIAQSEILAKNNIVYDTATITLQGTDIGNLTIYLSGDNGSNWEEVTNNVAHNFSNKNNQGIKFKIVATGSATVTYIKMEYT